MEDRDGGFSLREWLINLPPSASPLPDGSGISRDFRPWQAPGSALGVVRVLWGENPDVWMRLYRAAQLSALFADAEPPLGPFDWPWGWRLESGQEGRLYPMGEAPAADDSGRCYYRWRISWSGPWLRLERHQPDWHWAEHSLAFVDGVSGIVALPGGWGGVRLASGPDGEWSLVRMERPRLSAAQLYQRLRQLSLEAFWQDVSLASGDPAWQSAWEDVRDWTRAMRGLLLALRCVVSRRGGA